jgi:hypothetical protein
MAVSDRQVTLDAISVGCSIRAAHGDVIAALSVVARHGTVSPIALAPAVRTASRGISRALGAPAPEFRQAKRRSAGPLFLRSCGRACSA